jgi:hypothetical protein
LRNIEKALSEKGFVISHDTVGNVLKEMGYRLQQNQKMLQVGAPHPDRNAQFEYINRKCGDFIQERQPVISVDTKKKESTGNFKNTGAEYQPKKTPDNLTGRVAPFFCYFKKPFPLCGREPDMIFISLHYLPPPTWAKGNI